MLKIIAIAMILFCTNAQSQERRTRVDTPWPTGRPGGRDVYSASVCRPVLIRRTTIYVDEFGCEVYRTVSHRRAVLCETPRFCRECRE